MLYKYKGNPMLMYRESYTIQRKYYTNIKGILCNKGNASDSETKSGEKPRIWVSPARPALHCNEPKA